MAMRQSIVAEGSARRPREFWARLMQQWEGSGTSQQAVADAAGVSVYTLRDWVGKLRAEKLSAQPRAAPSTFVEVSGARPEAHRAPAVCRIQVGKRVVVELPALPPVEWLRALSKES